MQITGIELFLRLAAPFCLAYYFVEVAGFPMAIKKAMRWQGRLKPLDCVNCLTVWLALALLLLPAEVTYAVGVLFIPGFISTRIR